MTAHADPRIVVAVLERAAEMLEAGHGFAGVLAEAVRSLGFEPRVTEDGKRGMGPELWSAALDAEHQVDGARTAESRAVACRSGAETVRDRTLAVALFCGGLAGALPQTMRDLLAAHVAGDGSGWPVLRDLALEHGLGTDLAPSHAS